MKRCNCGCEQAVKELLQENADLVADILELQEAKMNKKAIELTDLIIKLQKRIDELESKTRSF